MGGGAEHSPEVARLFAYAATSGAEGVVSVGDLKVAPLDVPGSSVRVLSGAAIINSDAAGGVAQSYIGRNVGQDVVSIAATGSGSGRSDLIVARIEDPWMAGEPWADPANPKVGPYIFTRVIPNVSATTTEAPAGSSSIALARIDIPANTGTITGGMVKDLRKLALPRFQANKFSNQPSTAILAKSDNFMRWPGPFPSVPIPYWATWASFSVVLSGMGCTGNVDGYLRTAFGNIVGGNYIVDVDTAASREVFVVTGSGWIDASLRGKTQDLVVEGRLYPSSPGSMGSNTGSHVLYDINFYEYAV